MFVVEPSKEKHAHALLVDHARDVWLRYGSTATNGSFKGFLLGWGEREIPFDVQTTPLQDDTGQTYYLKRFISFGGSAAPRVTELMESYNFQDDTEREHATLLAIEAMIAFGGYYNGLDKPDGVHRIEHNGRIYTKKDFGTL
jgi:hypothetical protein